MMRHKRAFRAVHLLVGVSLLCLVSWTAEAADKKAQTREKRKAYNLELKAIPELKNGKIVAVEGTADPTGDRFMLKNLFILQPVAVTVLAKNKNDDIRIQLAKDRWDERVQEGSTKGVGSRTFKFRTQGDLRITVRSPQGRSPYHLVVWAGNEVKPEMKSAFKTPAKRGER